jgi:hypothetical protein
MHLGNGQPHQRDSVAVQSPPQHGNACAGETLLDRPLGRHLAFEQLQAGEDVARDHGGEQRPLIGEAGIDRRLSRARQRGDLVDAGAFESTLHEHLVGRVEDALLDLAREFLWRAPRAYHGTPCASLAHQSPPSNR